VLSSHQVNDRQFSSPQREVSSNSQEEIPKVLRYSGASFDLVNPHDSLRLSDILPSTEVERVMSDDFPPDPQRQHDDRMQFQPATRPRPRRVVYADYHQALAAVNRNGL
jgi:hypothetical protein